MNNPELLAIIKSQLKEIEEEANKITPAAAMSLIEVSEKLHRVQVIMQCEGMPDPMNVPVIERPQLTTQFVTHLRTCIGREPTEEEVTACLNGNQPEYQVGQKVFYKADPMSPQAQMATVVGVKLGIDWVYKLPNGEWVDPAHLSPQADRAV